MADQVTLPLRPGQAVVFPNVCVACGRPASDQLPISKKQGQTEYNLEVPVCGDCLRNSQRRSGREETLLRAGWLAAVAGGIMGLAFGWFITGDMSAVVRLLAALIAGTVAAGLAYWSFRRAAQAAELPEKRAVTGAVQISDFSWHDITLMLADEALAERVIELNTPPVAAEAAGQDDLQA